MTKSTARGLGTGMNPELGKRSAEESRDDIQDALKGSSLIIRRHWVIFIETCWRTLRSSPNTVLIGGDKWERY
jgi:cell division GTPase FtsZ